ncbi:MAG: hypothetical protein ACRD4Y_17260 [Candidatus Acidiferrales bacterium]
MPRKAIGAFLSDPVHDSAGQEQTAKSRYHTARAPSSCCGLFASCSSRHSKHTSAWHQLHVSM